MGGDCLSYPIIYDENATDFFNLGLGTLPDATKVEVTEERNGEFTLSMTYLVDGQRANEIKKNRIIKVDAGHVLKGQRFVIKKINRQLVDKQLQLQVYAEHVSYITNDLQLKPNVSVNGSGDAAIKAWRSNIIDVNPLVVDSDIETSTSTTWTIDKVQSARQALGGVSGSLLDLWGGEYRFDNYHISLKKQRGTVANTLLSYGRNITDFDQEENITDTYTTVYPYATYAETTTTDDNASSESKLMTLPELTVDSEYVGNYPNRKILPVDLTSKFVDNEKPTIDKLREYAKAYVKSNSIGIPTVSIKLSYVDLSQSSNYEALKLLEVLDLCDTVPVRFSKLGVDTKTKVSRVVWDVLAEHYTSMELGDTRYTIGDMINNALNTANEANQNSQEAQNSANHAVVSADGHTMIFYGPNTPVAKNVGDLWYQPDGEYETMYRWDGVTWAFVMSTRDTADAQKAADAAQKEAEEAKKTANESVAAANDAAAKAGFANDTATQAKSAAATAGQQAKDALTNVGTALTNAKNALDNVTKLDQTVKTEVTNINGQLAQKVSQTTFDTLKGAVTSQGTLINQNKAEIQLKADLSLVNTIKQTVTNNTATIDLNSKEIKLKASQSDVDKLSGRVTNAEAQIKLQADQIALTVSKAELNNTLSSYATQTWTQSQIKLTSDQINLSVSKVQTNLDNMELGSVNLIIRKDELVNRMIGPTGAIDPFAGSSVTKNIISVEPGKYLTLSRYDSVADNNFRFAFYDSAGAMILRSFDPADTPKVLTVPANAATLRVSYPTGARVKLERGQKGTEYSAAPEDLASEVQFSQLQVTVNGIQGTVQNKADQSQVTQLANQITSVVTNVEQIGNEGRNYFHNSNFARDLDSWGIDKTGSTNPSIVRSGYYKLGYKIGLHMFGTSNVPYNGFWQQTSMYGAAGDNVVLSFIAAQDENYDSMLHIGLTFYKDSQNVGSTSFDMQTKNFNNSSGSRENHVFKAPAEFNKVNVRLAPTANIPINIWLTNFKLESNKLTPYTEAPEDRATQSQITQLADSINLRVQKGDVVNQINISPEGILIDGKKVHITGQTTIDNAVIKDAMIADIKADKITAGTLNAANVNVINFNANNITTGTLKGANLSMNLNTGEILFQKGSIKSTNGNLNIDINDGSMAVLDGQDGFYFKNGKLSLSSDWAGNNLFGESKFGSIEYSHSLFGSSGMLVRGNGGLLLGTNKYKENVWVSNVVESGIAITPKGVALQSEGKVSILAGTKTTNFPIYSPPFISVGTDMDTGIGNRIQIYAEYVHIPSAYRHTDSGSANVVVAADGALVRSTSASKYKTDIIRTNATDYGDKLLNLPTATWTDIAETKRYRDDPVNQIKPTRNFGMIAEDLAEAGLEMLVVRGTDGELEGINYDRIGPALIPVIAKLKNEVEILKRKLEEKTA